MTKAEKINSTLNEVQEILYKINPKKRWVIYYGKPGDLTEIQLTDWNRERFSIRNNDEYFFLYSLEDMCLLYVINVSACSEMWSLRELFDLLGRKF